MPERIPRLGELDTRITIKEMRSTPLGVDLVEEYIDVDSMWAKHRPVSGLTRLDTKAMNQAITDKFYIRFRKDITSENWLVNRGQLFRIRMVEDIEDRQRFLCLFCECEGDYAN